MTPKQITAAKRMLAKLKKIETMLLEQEVACCYMLKETQWDALESNRQCQKNITTWLDLEAKFARANY